MTIFDNYFRQDKSSLNPDEETAEEAANDVTPTISVAEDKTPAAEKAYYFVSPIKLSPELRDAKHQLNVLAKPWSIDNRAEQAGAELCQAQYQLVASLL